jgi:hypothetical protein
MTVAAMITTPLAAIPSLMALEGNKKQRNKNPVWWIIVYTIHGTSSTGVPCKVKKSIQILKYFYGVTQILLQHIQH